MTWWKEERPKRPDPYDASGLNEYYVEHEKSLKTDDEDIFFGSSFKKDDPRWHELSDRCIQIEKEQDDEDTEMLIRLVKLRHHLWT